MGTTANCLSLRVYKTLFLFSLRYGNHSKLSVTSCLQNIMSIFLTIWEPQQIVYHFVSTKNYFYFPYDMGTTANCLSLRVYKTLFLFSLRYGNHSKLSVISCLQNIISIFLKIWEPQKIVYHFVSTKHYFYFP